MSSRRFKLGLLVASTSSLLYGCALNQSGQSDLSSSRLGEFVVHNYAEEDVRAVYDPHSHTFATIDGNFAVYFPSEPKGIPERYSIKHGNQVRTISAPTARRYILTGKDLDLLASQFHDERVKSRDPSERRATLNRDLSDSIYDFHFVETGRHPIRLWKDSAIEGIEAEGSLARGTDKFRMQMFFDREGRVYRMIAAGPSETVSGYEANQFFDSLCVSTDKVASLTLAEQKVAGANGGKTGALANTRLNQGTVTQSQISIGQNGRLRAGANSYNSTYIPEAHVYKPDVGSHTYIDGAGHFYFGREGGLITGPGGVYTKNGPSPIITPIGGTAGPNFGGFNSRHF